MTKDTEKALVIIYSEHLRRRSFGTAKNQAVQFEDAKLRKIDSFSTWNQQDIGYCLEELKRIGYIARNICGDVTLLEPGIKYMESKPKEFFAAFSGIIKGVVELIAAFL